MRKFAVGMIVGLLAIGLLGTMGCGGERDVAGNYISPEGAKLALKTDGTMTLINLPGATAIKGTYEVRDDKLSLYSPEEKGNKPLMTFRIGNDKIVELIDVSGLIWVRQPAE